MIIGISSKRDFGRWDHDVYAFKDDAAAEKWLHTEECDFRSRKLFEEDRKKDAVKLAGIKAVAEAEAGRPLEEPELWKALRKAYGITRVEMYRITKIPVRSIENWEYGRRSAPEYQLGLVECKLSHMEEE